MLEFRHVLTLYRISWNYIKVILIDFNIILIIFSVYRLPVYKHWCTLLRDGPQRVETCWNSRALIVKILYFNIMHMFLFSWILTISSRVWTSWNSFHRVGIKTAEFKSKNFCAHLSLMQNDIYCDFTKRMRKAFLNVMFFHPSVRLSVAWTSATPTGKIFVKFHFYWNLSTHSNFGQIEQK